MTEQGSVPDCDCSHSSRSPSGMGRSVAMARSVAWHSVSERPPEVAEGASAVVWRATRRSRLMAMCPGKRLAEAETEAARAARTSWECIFAVGIKVDRLQRRVLIRSG